MFNTTNDCFIPSSSSSSSSPSNQIFNRHNHHVRYHPYNRVSPSTSYYPANQLETYSFDPNSNTTIQNYDQSITSYDYNLNWTTPCSSIDNEINADTHTPSTRTVGGTGTPHCFKRRVSANKKERRRTQSINTAFSDLRTAIPNVQPDTKLSKIKTLKLATKYIEYLMDILAKDDPLAMPSAFKAEIVKTRKDHRDLMKYDNSFVSRKTKGRTGWPQTVWQSELNRSENLQQNHSINSSSDNSSHSPTLTQTTSSSITTKMNKIRSYEKSYYKL